MNKKILSVLVGVATLLFVLVWHLATDEPIPKDLLKKNNPQVLGEEDFETETYPVYEVLDGDTIKVFYYGEIETVRLIGIDTPEHKQCFHEEATRKLNALVKDKEVSLELDKTQGLRDRYNRLLAYIWFEDTLVNAVMIEDGYAFEYTYNTPYKYQREFQQAEYEARESRRGLWGDACAQENLEP